MSVMMAQSAPGPVPISSQPQFAQPPINTTTMRGHGRQPSSATRPVTQQGDTSFAGRRDPVQGDVSKPLPRVVDPSSFSSQPRGLGSSSAVPRVHAPLTSAQRPTTSHAGAPPQSTASANATSAAPGLQQGQASPSSVRATASRQTEPSQPAPLDAQPQGPRPNPSANSAPSASAGQSQSANNSSSSFPHAFERWEMLSSRWEGLTGYWVSRLEGNRQELSGLPIEQEMSRQITDLAAAGANLFQALIELQRLRASSERKFQRWFFETRADQERAREMSSDLERGVRAERQARADLLTEITQLKLEKAKAEKLAEETKRELQISKDECRRAWEELGRREEIERERTNSLREGHPTLINGVQVTPMPMPGVPSRSNSTATRPRTATGAFVPPNQTESYSDRPISGGMTAQTRQQQRNSANPTLHEEPEEENLQQGAGSTTSTQPADFYQQPQSAPPANPSPVDSYADNPITSPAPSGLTGVSEAFEVDEEGNIVVDEHGAPKYASRRNQEEQLEYEERAWGTYPYPDYEGEEYGGENGGQTAGNAQYGSGASTPSGGVGIGSGWDNVSRHHHPTRLSDVLEEDERLTNSDGRSALG